MATDKQLSMAASAIAMRGVRLFISAGRTAADRRAQPAPEPRRARVKPAQLGSRPPQKVFDLLLRTTRFNKHEVEALFAMYRRLVTAAQSTLPASAIGQPPAKVDGIDQGTFRDVMHNTLDMITEEAILERIWITWDRGAAGGEGALRFEAWVRGLSVLLKGTDEERRNHCFAVYDLNSDGFITKDEMFLLLKITEEAILERIWITWDHGAAGGEGALRFEAWVRGLSVLLKGTDDERRNHCFAVYDLNSDGFTKKDEMFLLLKNSLLKQPGDEDPDEGVRELVELVLKKLDVDKDGRVSPEDYRLAVEQEPLLLEAFGQCLPSRRHAIAFQKTLNPKI